MADGRCVFCEAVAGHDPAYQIYEDDATMAALVREPIRPGHVLVFPKAHVPDFYALEDTLYSAVMQTSRHVARAMAAALRPLKIGLAIVGFDFPHTHIHLIPLHQYREITTIQLFGGENMPAPVEELAAMTARLRDQLLDA